MWVVATALLLLSALLGGSLGAVRAPEVIVTGRTDGAHQLTVLAVCALHAREHATTRLCLEWARLSEGDPRVRWVIVPEANAAAPLVALGALSPCTRTDATGIDINRNFPLPPGAPDELLACEACSSPGGECYAGEEPLSHPAARRIDELAALYAPDVALAVHTGESLILAPHDFSLRREDAPENRDALLLVGKLLSQAVRAADPARDRPYVGAAARMLYPAYGTLTSHLYHAHGVPLVYTLETSNPLSGACRAARDRVCRGAIGHDPARPPSRGRQDLTPEASERLDCCRVTFVPHVSNAANGSCLADDSLATYLARWSSIARVINDSTDDRLAILRTGWVDVSVKGRHFD